MYVMPESCQVKRLGGIYERQFGDINGVFVDIGAFDGYTHSNVWGLVNAGWKGICVEPNPINFKQLVNTYSNCPQVLCLHAAVGKWGNTKISINQAVSTTSRDQIKWYQRHGWIGLNVDFADVASIPLDKILENCKVEPKFDVLSIDTEGTEMEIIRDFDIETWLPKMVIIEAHENHPLKGLGRFAIDINNYFAEHKYERIYNDVINNIYWRV